MKHMKRKLCLLFLFFLMFVAFDVVANEDDEDVARISKEEVQKLIGQQGVTLIDVRYEKNWKKSDKKIAGAVREHPNEIGSWIGKYEKDQKLIFYCD